MKRRDMLKAILGGSGLMASPFASVLNTAQAQTNLRTLIVIFQRGGCDGLNTVVPYGDSDYYNLRPLPTALAPENIGIPGPSDGLPNPVIDLDGFFGLHPELGPLKPIYDNNHLAVLPAVQYPSSSRSHFDGQNYIESAVAMDGQNGWLNRSLENSPLGTQLQAVSFGSSLAQSLRGNVPVSAFSSLSSFNIGLSDMDEQRLAGALLPVYVESPTPASAYRNLVHLYGQVLFGNLNAIAGIDTGSYVPENGAVYPNGGFGNQLRETAQLIKTGVGLQLVTISLGGWDTHSNQGDGDPNGRQARQLRQMAQGIAALYQDLGPARMDDVTVMTSTEFGRTAAQNGSFGTDHGIAAAWFIINNLINPDNTRRIYSDVWPGLAPGDLVNQRYQNYNVDYRDIYASILTKFLGHSEASLPLLIPGYSVADFTDIGLYTTPSV